MTTDNIKSYPVASMTILDHLVADVTKRQASLRADRNQHTYYLKSVDPTMLVTQAYGIILAGLQRKGTLVEAVASIGRGIRKPMKLDNDSVLDTQTGWFVAISFLELGILSYSLRGVYKNGKRQKYEAYYFNVVDWESVNYLWTLIDKNKMSGLYPSTVPAANWTGAVHEDGTTIIKKGHPRALRKINIDAQPVLFNVLNRLQNTGWRINQETFSAYQSALLHADALGKDSPFKFAKEIDKQKRKSLMREAESIQQIALSYINEPFYHMYNFDFRSRIYVNTAYLHEQSSDNAKGILKFSKGVPLGEDGYYWLRVHCSNCWGNDKVTLDDRVQFVDDHLLEFIQYAKTPMINREWMGTDSPFSFLTCCYELKRLMEWCAGGNAIDTFASHIPVYIDGSTNGTQHLTAMSLDETVAPLVNLVKNALPGDLYMYIAKYVWEELEFMRSGMTTEEIVQFEPLFEKSKELQKNYNDAPSGSEQKAMAYQIASEWRNANRVIRQKMFAIYWLNVTSAKDKRKICKR